MWERRRTGSVRKVSSCAPSTLILSGLFAWGTNSSSSSDVLLFWPPFTTNWGAVHCCVFYLCCPQTPTGERAAITNGGGGVHNTNLSSCGFNLMTLLERNHENNEFTLCLAFSVIPIEYNTKMEFIPSAAFVVEGDSTTSTFAQLRLGEVSSLAPRKYRVHGQRGKLRLCVCSQLSLVLLVWSSLQTAKTFVWNIKGERAAGNRISVPAKAVLQQQPVEITPD